MNNASRQTMALIGIALLAAAGIMIYISLNQPRVYEENTAVYSSNVQDSSQAQQTQSIQQNSSAPSAAGEESTSYANKSSAGYSALESGSAENPADSSSEEYSYPININTATLDELMSINGLGEARASAIIEYREYLGKYESVEQIKNIKGISDSIYNKVAPYLTV